MAASQSHKEYSAGDIEKYHKGQLSAADMHALERAALDDPFLADAMQGYQSFTPSVRDHLQDLQIRLARRTDIGKKRKRIFTIKSDVRWWSAAAAAILFIVAGFAIYRFTGNDKGNLSVIEKPLSVDSVKQAPAATLTNKNLLHDTAGVAITTIQPPIKTQHRFRTQVKEKDISSLKATAQAADRSKPDESPKADSLIGSKAKSALGFADKSFANTNNNSVSQARPSAFKANRGVNMYGGRILDADSNPVPFANITATLYHVGTYSDAQGYFTLLSSDTTIDVQVKSIGFDSRSEHLSMGTNQKIILKGDARAADFVINANRRDTTLSRYSAMHVEEPEPADGWTNYDTYIANNRIEEQSHTTNEPGSVELSFDVNSDGEPVDIRVEKSLCASCDAEAIRLVKHGPKWKKKRHNNHRVRISVPFDTDN